MNISLAGSNLFQFGNNTVEFSMNKNGPELPANYLSNWGHNPQRRELTDSLLFHNYHNDFIQKINDSVHNPNPPKHIEKPHAVTLSSYQSSGSVSCATGAKDWRCIGVDPCSVRASRWALVPYPL